MVEYKSKFFYRSLLAVLSTLLALNLLILAWSFNVLTLLPIGVLATVLYSVLQKTSWVRTAVRIWSFLLIVSGAAALLGTLLRVVDYLAYGSTSALAEINVLELALKLTLLGIGLAYFFLSKKYIDVDAGGGADLDQPTESEEAAANVDGT